MDDLSALQWASKPEARDKNQAYRRPSPAFTALRPTAHTAGPSHSRTQSPATSITERKAPLTDGFSNLVSFTSASSTKNLSLQEQQKILQDQKAQQQAAGNQQLDSLYRGRDEQFWNSLGSGRSTPASTSSTGRQNKDFGNGGASLHSGPDDHDLLAAFQAHAPVDASSHFPKPSEPILAPTDEPSSSLPGLSWPSESNNPSALDDDDPFGLAELPHQNIRNRQEVMAHEADHDDDTDVLGLLAKPASEFAKPHPVASPSSPPTAKALGHPQDEALAELIDMGFGAENARQALESTESGTNVQQAVSYLLTKAHADARKKPAQEYTGRHPGSRSTSPRRNDRDGSDGRQGKHGQGRHAWSNRTSPGMADSAPASKSWNRSEVAATQITSEFGNNLLKTAGTFWKASTKKVQQAVQDFNSDSDSSQPKWMRDPAGSRDSQQGDGAKATKAGPSSRPKSANQKKQASVTDEAMLLESDRPAMPPRKPRGHQDVTSAPASRASSTDAPFGPKLHHHPSSSLQTKSGPKTDLNRHAIEEQASQAYVSSSRRRRPAPKSSNSTPEHDLLENPQRSELSLNPTVRQQPQSTLQLHPQIPVVVRPLMSSRSVPSISPGALRASHASRKAGNDQFKRGDYSAAQDSYALSLRHLPTDHPITIVLYTNRALTSLKVGDPKTAISDSKKALDIIGAARGESEMIDLVNSEPSKPMREYFGKALMRQAEALEQIEKWKEAGAAWKEAVEYGHGGATSIQGRIRCEKAASPQRPQRAVPKPAKALANVVQARSAASGINAPLHSQPPAAAVNRLRAANAVADRVDDEKFALADSVNARLAAWKGSKADNLRALLASLGTVLWAEAGWKKIGMADLVLPTKVKVQYMKGIAKVHPDKLPPAASTEQRMIAGAVFSTLNEAWDKFKAENGL